MDEEDKKRSQEKYVPHCFPAEDIINVYPTAFMTPDEIKQRYRERREFEKFYNLTN